MAEREAGRSLRAIAAGLDADGIPTKHGGSWCFSTIASILRQERDGPGRKICSVLFPTCLWCERVWCQRAAGHRSPYCWETECQRAKHRDRFVRFKIHFEETHGYPYVYDSWKKAIYERRRKAIVAAGEAFTRLEVFERDGWVCGICTEPIDSELRYPEPRSASVDHIVPLSLDGEHTWGNVRAAHLDCNVRRGNRVERELVFGLTGA